MELIETKLNQKQFLLNPFLVHKVNCFCHEEDTIRSHPSLVSVLSEKNLMMLSLGLPLQLGAEVLLFHTFQRNSICFSIRQYCVMGQIFLFKKSILSNSFFQTTIICGKQANLLYTIYGRCHIHLQQFVVVIKYNH